MPVFAAKTDVGNREGENEDTIGWDIGRNLWLVADGMGGHANGQIASALAKETVLGADSDVDIRTQLLEAHQAILEAAKNDPDLAGMGSTIVVAKLQGAHAEVSWVGDSRAYLWRNKTLNQVSQDHSFLEVLRARKILSEEQLRADPRGNLVTQTLGHGDPDPSVESLSLRYGDWILLCSDGLSDELEHEEIANILAVSDNIDGAVDELMATALKNGGKDNTSVIIVECDDANMFVLGGQLLESKWYSLIIGAVLALVFAFVFWFSQ